MDATDERLGLPSASSFAADVQCPGRQNLLRAIADSGQVITAESDEMLELQKRGSRIHEARANGRHTLHLKDEGEVAVYKNGCLLEMELVGAWIRDFNLEIFTEAALEERLWLHNPTTLAPIISGQVDIVMTSPRHALITDWKSSSAYYVPPANRSWQLRVYAVLVWREYEGIENVRVAYVMPERLGEKLDFCDLTLFDLQRIEQEIFQVLWRSQQPDAELNAGAHCRFCAARGQCPAAAKMATLPAVTGNGDPLALVKAMPVADLAAVFKKKALVTKVFEAITARLSALSDKELDAIGLKRTAGRKLDTIKDVGGAYAWLRGWGISDTDLFSAMSFSKGKLVKLIAVAWSITEEAAEKLYDDQLDEFIERGRAKPSLVEK